MLNKDVSTVNIVLVTGFYHSCREGRDEKSWQSGFPNELPIMERWPTKVAKQYREKTIKTIL